jgi:hypothetical protein
MNDILYLGGDFSFSKAEVNSSNFASLDITINTWIPTESANPLVLSMISVNDTIFVCGILNQAGILDNVNGIAAFTNGTFYSNLDGGLNEGLCTWQIVFKFSSGCNNINSLQ